MLRRYRLLSLLTFALILTTPAVTQADASFSSASLDFGEVAVGEWSELTVTITNSGGAPLASAAELDTLAFEIVDGFGDFTLAPGDSQLVTVRFTPTVQRYFTGELSLTSGGTVACTGTGTRAWDSYDRIGLYADLGGTTWLSDLEVGVTDTLHVLAVLPVLAPAGITAAEFRIDGLPETSADGIVSVEWNTTMTLGTLDWDFSLAFASPQAGLIVELGCIILTPLSESWIDDGQVIRVAAGRNGGLNIVDQDAVQHLVRGQTHTLECTDPLACPLEETTACIPSALTMDFGVARPQDSRTLTIYNTDTYGYDGMVFALGDFDICQDTGGPITVPPTSTYAICVNVDATTPAQTVNGTVRTGLDECPEVAVTGYVPQTQFWASHIGLYADPLGESCQAPLGAGEVDTLYILAAAYDAAEGVKSATLRLTGLPASPADAEYEVIWNSESVTGDLETGVTVDFAPALRNGFIELGRIVFTSHTAAWPASDQVIAVPTDDTGYAASYVDTKDAVYAASGGQFTFNCSGDCDCMAAPCFFTPRAMDFGAVTNGEEVMQQCDIANIGDGALSFDLTPDLSYFTVSPASFTLDPGESQTVDITWSAPWSATHIFGTQDCSIDLGSGCGSISCTVEATSLHLENDFIGIFTETDAAYCHADLVLEQADTLHIMATVPTYAGDGILGAEFMIQNLPADPGPTTGEYSFEWEADTVTGDPATGISLHFDTVQTGPLVELGRMIVTPHDAGWVGTDHRLEVVETEGAGVLQILDHLDASHDVLTGAYTFNCSDEELCHCHPYSTPVLLSFFEAEPAPGRVDMRWEAVADGDATFRLDAVLADQTWTVPWRQDAPGLFSAKDASLALAGGGQVSYSLSAREGQGDWMLLRETSVAVPAAPVRTGLLPGYPNPFNPCVTLRFVLSSPQPARLEVFDVAGRKLMVLVDDNLDQGHHEIVWRGTDNAGTELASGIYFAKLSVPGDTHWQKLVLVR
ncbi:MAG: choice-of-anchor D domain-containing protein [Candidatus Krumholzibacteriota bacterium]|nr:choice-of-anchor D domain-containing protein [Candidatus Krumholzibacteriota bacterium]